MLEAEAPSVKEPVGVADTEALSSVLTVDGHVAKPTAPPAGQASGQPHGAHAATRPPGLQEPASQGAQGLPTAPGAQGGGDSARMRWLLYSAT